jgi:hypothetical protein
MDVNILSCVFSTKENEKGPYLQGIPVLRLPPVFRSVSNGIIGWTITG